MALLCILLFGEALPAAAAGRVTGRVRDANTGDVLPGAAVVVDGTSIGDATDEDGVYLITSAPSGSRTLVASYLGYESVERTVEIPDGGTIEVDFELVWEGVTGNEVVVTAQASGQMAAINQQLQSNTIANIVSADRIQELPDVNAAESIGRLPGVSIQRSGGEANRIAIRGLSPKYNTVTVNGVRVPSTGDDRSVDLSLIASNMLGGIEVRKAITPDMDADAIGGSVDLRLREAPDELLVDFSAQTGYNQLQEYYGNYKFAGSVSNRFFDSRLGIILNGSLDSYDRSADKLRAGYARGVPENPELQGDSTIIWLNNVNTREENVKRGRVGGSLVADYRIPLGKVTANAFYNHMDNDGLYRIQDYDRSSGRHAYWDLEDRNGSTSVLTGAIGMEQEFGLFRYDASLARTASRTDNPEDFVWRFGREDANSIIIPPGVFRE
ncbi:MAG TPA: carboxypeptidase-like regulatory domain-containing protein, partial [Rhodothermales bacterium]